MRTQLYREISWMCMGDGNHEIRNIHFVIHRLRKMLIGIEGPIGSSVCKVRIYPDQAKASWMYLERRGDTLIGYNNRHPRGRAIYRADQTSSDIDAIHSHLPGSRIWWR